MSQRPAQKSPLFKEIEELKKKIASVNLPQGLREKILGMISRLKRMAKYGCLVVSGREAT